MTRTFIFFFYQCCFIRGIIITTPKDTWTIFQGNLCYYRPLDQILDRFRVSGWYENYLFQYRTCHFLNLIYGYDPFLLIFIVIDT